MIGDVSLFFDQQSLREIGKDEIQRTEQLLHNAVRQCKERQKKQESMQRLEQAAKALQRARGHINGRNERSRGFYESIRTAQRLIDEALKQWNGEQGG